MWRRALIIFGVVCVLGVAYAWYIAEKGPPIRNREGSGTAIVAFGDSLIQGQGATTGNDLISILSKRLGRPIVNLGRSGDTTADALKRLPDVYAENPRIVIVLLGGNDYLRGVPTEQTFENLSRIVESIQEKGSAVLVLGVRGGIFRDTYAASFETLVKTHETGFVPDVFEGILGRSAYMADAIHPNDAGYAKIADRVEPVLRDLVGE